MIKINKELVKKVNELESLRSYLTVVVDNDKEVILSNLHNEVFKEVQSLNEEFTNKDIAQIVTVLTNEEPKELYLYDQDEIIEVLFPSIGKKNSIIQSAYYWIDSKNRIDWIINNALCDNKYYDIIDNINNNYILSREKLSNII